MASLTRRLEEEAARRQALEGREAGRPDNEGLVRQLVAEVSDIQTPPAGGHKTPQNQKFPRTHTGGPTPSNPPQNSGRSRRGR